MLYASEDNIVLWTGSIGKEAIADSSTRLT